MKKRIFIYSGEGAGERSIFHAARTLSSLFSKTHFINTLSTTETISSNWESDAALFVMPGGRDLPYCERLNGVGNRKIRSFVENGGAYLGLCAGGYYGCARIEFDRGQPLEVSGPRELSFFPGVAIGPAFGPSTFEYNSERWAKAVRVRWGNEICHSYYNGGCYFIQEKNDPLVEVLARYDEIKGTPAAIVQIRCGKGTALLTGIHPEFDVSVMRTVSEETRTLLEIGDATRFFCRAVSPLIQKNG